MEEKSNKPFENSTIELLLYLYKQRKPLLIVAASAFILSTIISFIVKPQYKANSILFSVRSFSTSTYLIAEQQGTQEDYLTFGDEDDLEKLLQIAQSEEVRKLVVEKFNLFKHWDIKDTDPDKNTWMKLKYDEMVAFRRTEMLSLKIEVYDYDKDTAALIANAIPDFIDTVKNRISRQIASKALEIAEYEYAKSNEELKSIQDSMQKIREMGVMDYLIELEAYSKNYAKAIANGKNPVKLEEKLNKLQSFGGKYYSLNDFFLKIKDRNFYLKKKWEEAILNLNRQLPTSFRVEKAVAPDRKSKPVRWLIVTISTLSALFFGIMFILISDKIKQIRTDRNIQ